MTEPRSAEPRSADLADAGPAKGDLAPKGRLRGRGLARVARILAHRRYLWMQRVRGGPIFIHINKCGGSSVERALGLPERLHDTALQRRRRIGARAWDANFSFALVRNPEDRVRSHHRFRVQTGQTGLDRAPLGLNDWIRAAYRDRDPAYMNNPLMFAPCHRWLSDADGRILVDRVLRLEDLEAGWPEIEAALGRPVPLGHVNRSRPAAPEPLDAEAKRVLTQHFAPDYEAFGYAPPR